MANKSFNKIPLRKLKHRGKTYLWKRSHVHLKENQISPCSEKVLIYLENYKNSPVQISFKEDDNLLLKDTFGKWIVGHPESSVIWYSTELNETINKSVKSIDLNSPKTIVKLIDFHIANGWAPSISSTKFINDSALAHIEELGVFESKD